MSAPAPYNHLTHHELVGMALERSRQTHDNGAREKYLWPMLEAAQQSLAAIVADLDHAAAALAEIHRRPYRAEEVTARYRRETQ